MNVSRLHENKIISFIRWYNIHKLNSIYFNYYLVSRQLNIFSFSFGPPDDVVNVKFETLTYQYFVLNYFEEDTPQCDKRDTTSDWQHGQLD